MTGALAHRHLTLAPEKCAPERCSLGAGFSQLQRLLSQLGQTLSQEFGKGFAAANLRHMRGFFQAFPNCDACARFIE